MWVALKIPICNAGALWVGTLVHALGRAFVFDGYDVYDVIFRQCRIRGILYCQLPLCHCLARACPRAAPVVQF